MSRKTVLLFFSVVLAASLSFNLWLLMRKGTVFAPVNFGYEFAQQIFEAADLPCWTDSDCKFWNAQAYCDMSDMTFMDKDIGVCGKEGR